ncbi:MAG TPA: class I SAM-dependent methyltransferase [Anaeromyxobacteraceae bacterium]|nr:class I SAM-dependent methyltransferase [Anaeromyxobacteraceae bacterium]
MPPVPRDLLAVLACPDCGGGLSAGGSSLRCGGCERAFPVADGIPDLRGALDARASAVRDFYALAPFPGYPPRDSYPALRARAGRSTFAELLDRAIAPDATVLEVGCGTGQMSLFLATGERRVVGADLSRASLLLAAEAARRFGIERARFVEMDLRQPALRAGAFDVVYCSGVLHHTPDPEASFRAIARLVRPRGVLVAGLYNAYARWPHRLRRAVARLTRFRWIPLDPVLRERAAEPARRLAWLRDQYRHPEEHRHTLAEVQRWFRASGVEYFRTYPSTVIGEPALRGGALFAPAPDDWAFENVLQQLGWSWTLSGEGGLFVVVGRRRDAAARDPGLAVPCPRHTVGDAGGCGATACHPRAPEPDAGGGGGP